jgi:hypothetical protein
MQDEKSVEFTPLAPYTAEVAVEFKRGKSLKPAWNTERFEG